MAKHSVHLHVCNIPSIPTTQSFGYDATSVHRNALKKVAATLESEITTVSKFLSIARRYSIFDERHATCIRFAKKTAKLTEAALWKSSLEPPALIEFSAKIERLWFEIDELS